MENFLSCGGISDIEKFEMWRNLRCGDIVDIEILDVEKF